MTLARLPACLAVLLAVAGAARAQPAEEGPAVPATADGVERLVEALRGGESFRVRATAAVALGRLADARALPALQEALRSDGSYAVRAAACAALGRVGDPAALPGLIDGLRDPDEYVRAAAEEAMSRFHAPRQLFSFRELLTAPDEVARRAAVRAYGDVMRSPDASPGLAVFVVNALADDSEVVVQAAEGALAALPHERVLPLLLDGLRSDDSGVRAGCARLLSRRADKTAVEPLVAVLLDTDSTVDVRRAAQQALVKHADYIDAGAAAAAASGGGSVSERIRGVRILAALGDARATTVIERALADAEPTVRVAGARAAADLGGAKARASLEAALARESDPRQRRQLELLLRSMAR
jgi:HEAT repeat protein